MVIIGFLLKLAMMSHGSISLMFIDALWASRLSNIPTPTKVVPVEF